MNRFKLGYTVSENLTESIVTKYRHAIKSYSRNVMKNIGRFGFEQLQTDLF